MSQGLRSSVQNTSARRTPARRFSYFIYTLLLVEFLDEFVYGAREAAWPLVRDDLRLSYAQIGLALAAPGIVGIIIETFLGVLGDVWNRRALVLGGGLFFAAGTLLVASSDSFTLLLVALCVLSPASGAFVGLSQAALMDAEPARREQNMARWAFSGSLGNVAGPLALGAAVALGWGWRGLFLCLAALTLVVVVAAWRLPFPVPTAGVDDDDAVRHGLRAGLRDALRALRRREVVRWLLLLEFGDFTWDVLRGFLALYFVDVVGVSLSEAAFAVFVWTLVGLPGDFLIIPLLERVRGLSYLRVSTACVIVLFPAFMLAPGMTAKLFALGLLGLANAGWYSILKAQLYKEMEGRSGAVMTLQNVSGIISSTAPLALGAFAQRYGLEAMMWLLLVGPLVLLAGLLTTRDDAGPAPSS
ncbi:MAG TPA: MFS transporter [Pyrinomonadaceae bacterium]